MSQTINDMPVSLLPWDIFTTLLNASASGGGGVCQLIKYDGSFPPVVSVSTYKYLEELAKRPDLYGAAWKQALISVGVGAAGSTVGMGTLILATGPLAPFTALAAAIAAPFFGGNRLATLIVCNNTVGDMKMAEIYQDCGVQTGRPVFADVDIETGSTRSTNPDLIPGKAQIVPGLVQGGVGMYRFEKNLDMGIGFYGTGGAISWTFTDPTVSTTMAFSWLVPETGDPGYGVTADLNKYASLQDFYEKTAGARERETYDSARSGRKRLTINVGVASREYPDKITPQDLCFTISCGY